MYNNIITQTPNVKHKRSEHKPEPDTLQTYTPQPSTPIKHAGSDC